jgi:hypothetical protein
MSWIMLLQVIVVIVIVAAVLAFLKAKAQDSAGDGMNHKKQLYKTLASGVLLTFFLAQPHAGFMIYIFVLPLLIWFIYSLYVALTKPDRRKWHLIRMSVWIASVLVILVVHYDRKQTIRHYADDIVAAINKYKLEHGTYPDNIEMIGVSRQQLKEQLGLSGYSYEKGKPGLFYADTFIVFQTHHYDFQKNTWVYHAD